MERIRKNKFGKILVWIIMMEQNNKKFITKGEKGSELWTWYKPYKLNNR